MSPKKKFSEDEVVEAAFEIAKKEGIENITIRKVADQLGSSIAPIYVNFVDVDDLKRAVVKKIVQLSEDMIHEQHSENSFRDIGIASLKFAEEYPVLFKEFAMKPNDYMQEYDQEMGDYLITHMKSTPELQVFSDEELKMILFKMRAFQLGLTMMVANRSVPEEFDLEQMIAFSDDVAEDVVSAAHLRKQKSKHEN
ncbi:TetR/AcrR family transcriptional regulator [Desertibacillus haloalkaliphilus]|uniref:TetR/AcrR family transcriptional regulator n=1 Tax=Desertibacillus haloalkaliphilus TaxID=1328930 RepID=UPI001C26EA77|nr:TetR/AcrR family transcriptional regulator [Desertibacillus haloalkaliphilus]MBU8907658.1 TetR/AcrR family transcriptional regulator [Desertibacillus haloalkaliphilus]